MTEGRFYRFIYRLVFPLMHLLFRIRYRNRDLLPDGPVVLCAPHSSMLDPLFLMYLLGIGRHIRFLAKKELLQKPILGAILKGMGVIGLDRGNADVSAIRTALNILKSGGIIGIFPEGTRMQKEVAGSAKTGAILLASRSGAKLLPVWLPRGKKLFSRVEIAVGEAYTLPRLHGGSEAYQSYADDLMKRIVALRDKTVSCA